MTWKARILVVEDFKEFRRVIRTILEKRSGFEIHESFDGLDAVRKAEEIEPDLVLLDINLPRVNGIEVARRLQTLKKSPRIVFLSQERSLDFVEAAFDLGASGYVQKLKVHENLFPAIDSALAGRRFVSEGLLPTSSSELFGLKLAAGPGT
jgi:two-component system, NarL family, response regulator DegU